MKEKWKCLNFIGYPKHYISNKGRLLYQGKLAVPYLDGYKYWLVYLRDPLGGEAVLLHRLVAMAFIPNPKQKPEVHHRDLNPGNPKAQNLKWVTRAEHKALHYECN